MVKEKKALNKLNKDIRKAILKFKESTGIETRSIRISKYHDNPFGSYDEYVYQIRCKFWPVFFRPKEGENEWKPKVEDE